MSKRESNEGSISGAAGVIGSATVLSRILGYIRDASVAHVFGAAMQTDAFFVAFRISNLLRRLVGEGALTSSFVPIFTEELTLRTRESARGLSSSIFTLFGIILVILSVIGILLSEQIVTLMSPGFLTDPEKFDLTVRLTKVMFPYMVAVGLVAIGMGVLNSLKHFAAPALSPVFFNISIIASIFLVAPFLSSPVYALPIGVLAGGVFQFLILIPFLARYSSSWVLRPLAWAFISSISS
jgi:putative peptidoglycan lipid II flippase